jgi:hypothetical protein
MPASREQRIAGLMMEEGANGRADRRKERKKVLRRTKVTRRTTKKAATSQIQGLD